MADTMIGMNSWTNHATFDMALGPLKIILKFTICMSLESGLHHALQYIYMTLSYLCTISIWFSLSYVFVPTEMYRWSPKRLRRDQRKKVVRGVRKVTRVEVCQQVVQAP